MSSLNFVTEEKRLEYEIKPNKIVARTKAKISEHIKVC